ncbi:TPR repeat-containing protein YfgC precursor [Pirellulimonas nuda]|uniref:TPR repeat-containing protein YfgC n=1 Tax=Pirellulimonas nuda TaxID=2528009 RepID=A0A518DH76_9BACT|nr:M48 family metalloprotease [Pirellulimonas nuda]QDU90831.1 TPR repeat-containing protein YfgC precursor [Pirellulimonas nuda]
MFGVGRQRASGGGMSGFKVRLLIALAIAAFALISYYGQPGDENRITGEEERVAMHDEQQEVQMGLQAKPELVQMHGGPTRDAAAQRMVSGIGQELLGAVDQWIAEHHPGGENPYRFEFTLLADPKTVNAFALPGGQVFITQALFDALETEGQLAGVLGHEVGHVIARHGNKRMAKQQLFSGLAAAGGVAGGDVNAQRMSQMIAQMVSMKYGRDDELESDKWGVRLCELAGYDPRAMIGVMKVLEEASGSGGPPEMMSTHPKPANRVAYIQGVIAEEFPQGVPKGLKP